MRAAAARCDGISAVAWDICRFGQTRPRDGWADEAPLPAVGKSPPGPSGSRVELSGGLVCTRPGAGATLITTHGVSDRHRTHTRDCPPAESELRDCGGRASSRGRLVGREHKSHHRQRCVAWRLPRAGHRVIAAGCIGDGVCADRGAQLAPAGNGQLRAYARALTGRALQHEASTECRHPILQTAQAGGVIAACATDTVGAHLDPELPQSGVAHYQSHSIDDGSPGRGRDCAVAEWLVRCAAIGTRSRLSAALGVGP
jgi:hypothetical protein